MCDFAELYEERFRRARKEHKCGECGRTIREGERYSYTSMKFEGEFSDHKTCVRCDRVRDAIFKKYEIDCGIPLGGLFSEIESTVIEQMRVVWKRNDNPRPCRRHLSPDGENEHMRKFVERLEARSRADERRGFEEMERLFPAKEGEPVT